MLNLVKTDKSVTMICSVCGYEYGQMGVATQVFRRNGLVVTVTGIPAEQVCDHCGNAVLDWETAEQVEALIQPLFSWADNYPLPKPVVTVTFPEPILSAP